MHSLFSYKVMDGFGDENSILDDNDWVGCLSDGIINDPYQLIDEVLIDDDFLNFRGNLSMQEPDRKTISTGLNFDNFSESNSSDSGNYSPKSSSSDQQLSPLKLYELNNFSSDLPSNFVILDDHVQTDINENFSSLSDEFNDNNFVLPKCSSSYEAKCFSNLSNNSSSSSVTFVENSSPESSIVYTTADNNQQQLLYVMQNSPTSANQFVTVPCINAVQPIQNAQIAPIALTKVCSTSALNLRAVPMNFYVNKRPLPRANNFAQNATPNLINSSIEDYEFVKRKEDRKLRNRAAAQLSRQRKRTEFEQLKSLLNEKDELCTALKKENETLRKRIFHLEDENKMLQSTDFTVALKRRCPQQQFVSVEGHKKAIAKTAGGVCALVFMAVMIFPTGNYFEKNSIRVYSNVNNDIVNSNVTSNLNFDNENVVKLSHVGRSLLAIEENYVNLNNTVPNLTNNTFFLINTSFVGCPGGATFSNASQNIKLNMDLFNWIDRHEQMNFVQLRRGKAPSLIFNSRLTTNSMLEAQREFSKIFLDTQIANNWTVEAPANEKSFIIDGLKSRFKKNKNPLNAIKMNDLTKRKKNLAKKKALRDRAWKHLDVISTERIANNYQINATSLNNSTADSALFRLGPIRRTSNFSVLDLPPANTDSQRQMSDFISKIQQKEDTLYVVALKNYFLLPARERSITKLTPKVSIILPALSVSSAPSQIAMMRIECSVVATDMFFLPEGYVSLFNYSPPIF